MSELKDDSHIIHFGVKQNFQGYKSLCGNNSQNITVGDRVHRVYGGAKRTTDPRKVNCPDCLKLMNKTSSIEKEIDYLYSLVNEK